ncbi:MAG: hypothetical protein JETCAE03_35530 [Ignavibacteriaceae bacterium]|nr:MAG: hypothetical protein JETCAE03_35530 [Ignavibacteriaceae bacterium]
MPDKFTRQDYLKYSKGLGDPLDIQVPSYNLFESQNFLGQPEIPFRPLTEQRPYLKDLMRLKNPEKFIAPVAPKETMTVTGDIVTEGEPKKEDLTFGQRGLNQINDLLLGLNQQNTGFGEVVRQLGTPIASGILRTRQAMQPTDDITEIPSKMVDLPLGIASTAFGTLMTPFSAIKLGVTEVGGETAGKISEIGSLLLAGGVPLVAGYFAAEGSHTLAEKILDGSELSPKDQERILEATGLISFVLGHKVTDKTIKSTNKKLQKKVEGYLDGIFPEQKRLKTVTIDDIKRELQGIKKEKISELIRKDTERVLDKQDEYTLTEQIPKEDIRGADVLSQQQINKIVNPEVKPIETLLETPKVESKTPQRDLLNSNKQAIKEILDSDPSLSGSPRAISKRLTSSVEQGKLPKKVSLETIKTLANEWVQNRPKPKEQKVDLPETPLEEIKLPGFYGKNTSPTVGYILKDNPEFRPLVEGLKDPKEIYDKLNSALIEKRKKPETPVEEAQVEQPKQEIKPDDIISSAIEEAFNTDIKALREELANAKKESLKRSPSLLGGGQAEIMVVYAKMGAYYLRQGAQNFDTWAKEMIKEVGDEVRPYLRPIWQNLQQNTKIDDTKIKKWIDEYKGALGLTLEKVEGKIIDPNTGLEGAARNVSKRQGSVIQYNENTKGKTWYHEISHAIYNRLRELNPEGLNKYRDDIKAIIGESDKPFSEQFADAFTEMYTNPRVPETNLFKVIQNEFDIPRSFDLKYQKQVPLGLQKPEVREPGVREEKSLEWLENKYDAPKDVTKEIFDVRQKEEYNKLRDDGTQTFKDAVKEADKYQDITEESLLQLDPKTLNGKTFNKAQQIRIDQIALNKALKVVETRKAFGENLSTDQAKTLNRELTELMQLQALAKNNLREAARVLESAKKSHRMSPQEYELIQDVAKELGRTKDLKDADKITDPTLKDKALYWWYNSILSNPLTDIANIIGNASNLAFEILRQPQALFNGSALRGLIEGYKNAKRVWDGEQSAISKYTDRAMQLNEILKTKSKAGTRVKNTLLPTSRLAIEDAFFRSIFESMRETSQAKQTAKELGVSSKEIIDIYTDILEKGTSKNRLVTELGTSRFEKEVDAIENYANKMVFQKELGGAGKSIQRALNYPIMLPVKMLALPFLRIAINLSKVSAEASPFGLLKPLLKRAEYKELTKLEKQDIYSRAIAGTVFYTGLLSLLANETVEITGEAPRDKDIRDLWYKSGYEPYSIIINKDGKRTVIPYQNVSPINIVLGSIGSMITDAKYKKTDNAEDVLDKSLQAVLGFVKAIGNQSFLQGTSQLMNAIERTDENIIKSSLVRMTTPNLVTLFQGSADFGEGKNIYQVESLLDQYKSRLGITGDLKTKPDVFGEDLRSTYRRFPIPKEREINEISELLLRTGNAIGDPSNPKIQGKEIYTDEQFNEYKRYYRGNVYKILNEQFDIFKSLEKEGELGTQVIPKLLTNIKEIAKEMAKVTIEEKK